jgi:hypothetical protein
VIAECSVAWRYRNRGARSSVSQDSKSSILSRSSEARGPSRISMPKESATSLIRMRLSMGPILRRHCGAANEIPCYFVALGGEWSQRPESDKRHDML